MVRSTAIKVLLGFLAGIIISAAWYAFHVNTPTHAPVPLYTYQGKIITSNDLKTGNKATYQDITDRYHAQLRTFASDIMLQRYLSETATREKVSEETVLKHMLNLKEPTQDEILKIYKKAKIQRDIKRPLSDVKEQIKVFFILRAAADRHHEILTQVMKEKHAKVLVLSPEEVQATSIKTEGMPTKGSKLAKITIVDFFDYRCPHCRIADARLNTILKQHGDQVQVIYANFPLDPSEGSISRIMAEGALCAHQQNQYWQYNEQAFAQQDTLSPTSAFSIAHQLPLNENQFKQCMSSTRPQKQLDRILEQGKELAITGTPTIFVNGHQIHIQNLQSTLENLTQKSTQH